MLSVVSALLGTECILQPASKRHRSNALNSQPCLVRIVHGDAYGARKRVHRDVAVRVAEILERLPSIQTPRTLGESKVFVLIGVVELGFALLF